MDSGWRPQARLCAGLAIVAEGFLAAAVTSTVGLSHAPVEQRAFVRVVLKDPTIAPVRYATCQALDEPTLSPIIDAVGHAPQRDDWAFDAGWFAVGVGPLVDLASPTPSSVTVAIWPGVGRGKRTLVLHQIFKATALIDAEECFQKPVRHFDPYSG